MGRRLLPVWILGGCPEPGRAIRRAEDLAGNSSATFKVIRLMLTLFQSINRGIE
jgi:hypothetical protein